MNICEANVTAWEYDIYIKGLYDNGQQLFFRDMVDFDMFKQACYEMVYTTRRMDAALQEKANGKSNFGFRWWENVPDYLISTHEGDWSNFEKIFYAVDYFKTIEDEEDPEIFEKKQDAFFLWAKLHLHEDWRQFDLLYARFNKECLARFSAIEAALEHLQQQVKN